MSGPVAKPALAVPARFIAFGSPRNTSRLPIMRWSLCKPCRSRLLFRLECHQWIASTLPLACIIAMLASCATVPQGPAPIATSIQTVTVEKEVPVACIKAADIPAVPVAIELPPDLVDCIDLGCLYRKATALKDYVKALRDYVDLADPIFRQCSIVPAKVTP
jgi:hypothetical protein